MTEEEKKQKLDEYTEKYLNREFTFDINSDALYNQYKDVYNKQGKMAMQDTMGQAAALTGGYGSSYASTAGNQAYQASLDNLNNVIPELYQMAYNRYNQEGQDLLNEISLLQANMGAGANARDLSAIRKRAATFTNNGDLADYLASVGLDEATQKMLMAEYGTPDRKSFAERTWEEGNVKDGNFNWFGGIDNNAEYKDEYGDTYTGKQIYKELIAAGMDKTEAYDWMRKFQKDHGATKD